HARIREIGESTETRLMSRATGNFEVTLNPLAMDNNPGIEGVGRMSIDKQYHGELEATGQGQMLTGGTTIKNSAGYVAIERVTGSLKGRKGSFILQHNGIMTRGTPSLVISIVPDSGTDQLDGLRGTMSIRIEGGKHFYDLTYTLGTA
ncbi:MAG TPA: DUF3224 domain-containing protein, partial [Gemmatimonadaceae bacterium]|nr:DUF3224 domain-containing protein [Gemmatimonadaceae bacterium]